MLTVEVVLDGFLPLKGSLVRVPSFSSYRTFPPPIMSQQQHPLQHPWVIWEHRVVDKGEDWKNSMMEVCEFSTVEDFWKYW